MGECRNQCASVLSVIPAFLPSACKTEFTVLRMTWVASSLVLGNSHASELPRLG
jgi:hypothetical protein